MAPGSTILGADRYDRLRPRTGMPLDAPSDDYRGATFTFTVFTATYNRAHTLHRVYESLAAQTFTDFEWIIVDDGSEDHTRELVEGWRLEAAFPIRYFWQENSGKGRALKKGVAAARGELFLNLDSDDACVPRALERFWYHWHSIPSDRRPQFTGVSCLVRRPDGKLVGTPFPSDPTDSDSLEIRLRYRVTGDKWGFHRTDILRKFPVPEVPNGKRVPDGTLWNRIALRYRTRFVNEVLRIYYPSEVSRGSLSSQIRSASGALLYYTEFVNLDYPVPIKPLLKAYANYVRFSLHAGTGLREQVHAIRHPLLWALALPVGIVVYLRDRRFLRRDPSDEGARRSVAGR